MERGGGRQWDERAHKARQKAYVVDLSSLNLCMAGRWQAVGRACSQGETELKHMS
jgi:hypothetical protein